MVPLSLVHLSLLCVLAIYLAIERKGIPLLLQSGLVGGHWHRED